MTLPGLESEFRSARVSPCGKYRYDLVRTWDETLPLALWIMLNPSTADAAQDDPTIRRCRAFSRREGAGGMVVVNLFAHRATKPDRLLAAEDPVGPRNEESIALWLAYPEVTIAVAAWGQWRDAQRLPPRCPNVADLAREAGRELRCLGRTKEHGSPRHPLYVRADQALEVYP